MFGNSEGFNKHVSADAVLPPQKKPLLDKDYDNIIETPEDWTKFEKQFKKRFRHEYGNHGLDCGLFRVGWYNDLRKEVAGGKQCLGYENDNLAIVITTDAKFFPLVENYCGKMKPDDYKDPLDETTEEIIELLEKRLQACGLENVRGFNTDEPVEGKHVHVQSMGYVSGIADFHHEGSVNTGEGGLGGHKEWVAELKEKIKGTRDPALWGDTVENIVGVSLHKKFGGWFAFRMLFIIPDIKISIDVEMPERTNTIPASLGKVVLEEFNCRPNHGLWRDFIPFLWPKEDDDEDAEGEDKKEALTTLEQDKADDAYEPDFRPVIKDVRYPDNWWLYFTLTSSDMRKRMLQLIVEKEERSNMIEDMMMSKYD